ncbi:hypothetical protein HDV00_006820 [Rhizophlyctis rosea]|nr:hypothetical protein HDV00_006820 [Rhizophlyctis rosea]
MTDLASGMTAGVVALGDVFEAIRLALEEKRPMIPLIPVLILPNAAPPRPARHVPRMTAAAQNAVYGDNGTASTVSSDLSDTGRLARNMGRLKGMGRVNGRGGRR